MPKASKVLSCIPNPASSWASVFATFAKVVIGQLMNAVGQTIDRGFAVAGTRVVVVACPGWYVVKTEPRPNPWWWCPAEEDKSHASRAARKVLTWA